MHLFQGGYEQEVLLLGHYCLFQSSCLRERCDDVLFSKYSSFRCLSIEKFFFQYGHFSNVVLKLCLCKIRSKANKTEMQMQHHIGDDIDSTIIVAV